MTCDSMYGVLSASEAHPTMLSRILTGGWSHGHGWPPTQLTFICSIPLGSSWHCMSQGCHHKWHCEHRPPKVAWGKPRHSYQVGLSVGLGCYPGARHGPDLSCTEYGVNPHPDCWVNFLLHKNVMQIFLDCRYFDAFHLFSITSFCVSLAFKHKSKKEIPWWAWKGTNAQPPTSHWPQLIQGLSGGYTEMMQARYIPSTALCVNLTMIVANSWVLTICQNLS